MNISYKFWKHLQGYQEVYIYGNGVYGNDLYQKFCLKGYQKKLISFVVTFDNERETERPIPVIQIDDLTQRSENSIIVIAVSSKYKKEIEQELDKRGYDNYIAVADYEQIELEDTQSLRNISIEECCGYMADYYLYKNNLTDESYIKQKKYYFDLAMHRPEIEKNKIIVICGNINVGLAKIIMALKKRDFDIEVWKFRPTYAASPAECELIEYGISIDEIEDYEEVLLRAVERHPLVFYLSLPIGGIFIDEILIKLKWYFGKMVFTEGDVIKVNEYNVPDEWYRVEKYCLEHADGVVWRYPAKDFLSREFGYQYKGASIQMWDYCTDYDCNNQKYFDDNTLKICFLPTNVTHHLDESEKLKKYVHYASLKEMLKIFGNKNNCVFHCFSWNATEEELEKLKKLKDQYTNFEYFIHTPHSELIKKMGNYDYGIMGTKMSDPVCYPPRREDGLLYTRSALTYAVCNKHFDYLAAGIPVIGYYPEIQFDYLESLGVAVKRHLDDLDIEYLIEHKKQYRDNVIKAGQELSINTHVEELIEFMHGLYE